MLSSVGAWRPSLQVALDWAGQLLRVHGVRLVHLADRLTLPNPGVHGAVPHVARQQAILEDASPDGIRNRYCSLAPAAAAVRDAVAAL